MRHAVMAGAAATALLAAIALPLLSVDTGPPSASYLPQGDPARASFERVATVMGPGWPTRYNLVVLSKTWPITDPKLLVSLDRFQARLARDKRIASVVGPGMFAATSRDLGVLPKQLEDSSKLLNGGKKDLGRLQAGLGRAGAGATQLRSGLASAADGAGQLSTGSGQAQSGAGQLQAGLASARSGAATVSGGLAQALDAARRLRDGAGAALKGSSQVTAGLTQAAGPLKSGLPFLHAMTADMASGRDSVKGAAAAAQQLSAQLDAAATSLQALPSGPEAQAALAAVQSARDAAGGVDSSLGGATPKLEEAATIAAGFTSQAEQLSAGLAKLQAGSAAPQSGIAQLRSGSGQLATGIEKLSGGGRQLTTGITALRDGAGRLETGLAQLTGGAGQLASGLSAGTGPTGQLVTGLGKLESGVAKFRGQLPSTKDLERLQRESPGLFQSGYFVLAAIAGAPAAQRNQVQASLRGRPDRRRGRRPDHRLPRSFSESSATQRLGEDLQRDASRRRADATQELTHTGRRSITRRPWRRVGTIAPSGRQQLPLHLVDEVAFGLGQRRKGGRAAVVAGLAEQSGCAIGTVQVQMGTVATCDPLVASSAPARVEPAPGW